MLSYIALFLLSLQTSPLTIKAVSANLEKNFHYTKTQSFLLISIQRQEMYLVKNDSIEKTYRISTSKYGIGNKEGSNQTPLGVHRVAEKIGANASLNTIFLGRKQIDSIATIISDTFRIESDDVTSR